MWAFDPQQIALEPATWWWNPLSYVTDDTKAAKLAAHFASGSRARDARADPYFDDAGQDLLAGSLLAAALDGRSITAAFTWTTRPGDDTPVEILRDHGYHQMVRMDSTARTLRGATPLAFDDEVNRRAFEAVWRAAAGLRPPVPGTPRQPSQPSRSRRGTTQGSRDLGRDR